MVLPLSSQLIKSPETLWTRLQQLKAVYLAPALLTFLGVWLGWIAIQTVQRIFHYYIPLPMEDYFRVVQNLEDYESFRLATLWRQHNEHRIVFPEIVFALDILFLRGFMVLPIVLSCLSYVATWLVMSSTLFTDAVMNKPVRLAAIGIAGIVSFWEGVANLLAVPFLLQWTLMQLAVAVAFFCLSKLRIAPSRRYLAGTIAACIVATYSSGNALLLWPLILVVAVCIRMRRRDLGILAVAATVTLGVYFIGYHFTGELKLKNFVDFPLYSIQFIASYLSMPFGAMRLPMFGVEVGLLMCASVAALFVVAVVTKRLVSIPGIVLFGYWIFTFLTAVLTAGGRMDPNDPEFRAAKVYRYLTVPEMNWAVLILLFFWALSGIRKAKVTLPAFAVLQVLALSIVLPKLMPWVAGIANIFAEHQLATLTIEDGLHNSYWMKEKVFPDVAFLDTLLTKLRNHHLSVYYRPKENYLARPVQLLAKPHNETPVQGAVSEAFAVESGYQVEGWADVSQWNTPFTWLVFTDESSAVVGFGKRLGAGLPTEAYSPKFPSSFGWVGFIPSRIVPRAIYAYVVAPRGKELFPLVGSRFDIVPLKVERFKGSSLPLSGVEWKQSLPKAAQPLPGPIDFGDAPDTAIVSTWNGSDANADLIQSSVFARPANGCVIVPVLHGPSIDGLSVRIKDAEKGKLIADVPFNKLDGQWRYWQVSLDQTVKSISIEAEDSGREWGEWLAVSTPRACR